MQFLDETLYNDADVAFVDTAPTLPPAAAEDLKKFLWSEGEDWRLKTGECLHDT